MAKPSEEELTESLKMAGQMIEKKLDPFCIAKTLLNHNYRIGYLEKVLKAADRYINMGMSDREHTVLLRAIEKAKESEARTAKEDISSFGLE